MGKKRIEIKLISSKVREILERFETHCYRILKVDSSGQFTPEYEKEITEAEAAINVIIEDAKMEWYNKGLEGGRNEAKRAGIERRTY